MVTKKSIKPDDIRSGSDHKTSYPAFKAAREGAEAAIRDKDVRLGMGTSQANLGVWIDHHDHGNETKKALSEYIDALVYPIAFSDCPLADTRISLLRKLIGKCSINLSPEELRELNESFVNTTDLAFNQSKGASKSSSRR